MYDFLIFLADLVKNYPLHVDIGYCKTTGWLIDIYKKGCAEEGKDLKILLEQDSDIELCFAKAHVSLKEWLLENRGGY